VNRPSRYSKVSRFA